jgi:hypothetical protein
VSGSAKIARKIFGINACARVDEALRDRKLPHHEKTSMPVISTEADTVGLESARTKWEIMPTSTMM